MLETRVLWNEPNNLSHWNFQLDPEWKRFSEMVKLASSAIRRTNPQILVVLGEVRRLGFERTVALTVCFTPAHLDVEAHCTSPTKHLEQYAEFAAWAAHRYGRTAARGNVAGQPHRKRIPWPRLALPHLCAACRAG